MKRLTVRWDLPSLFLSFYLPGIPIRLQLADFVADNAAEALIEAHIKPDRRALYKDVPWLSSDNLIEGTKRRLMKGKPVIWLWSSPYLSILSLGQQGCLLRDIRRDVLKKAEKNGIDTQVVDGAFDSSYLGFSLPVCVSFHLKSLSRA